MFTYLVLASAIATEVVATLLLKRTEGFSRLVPSVAVVVMYAASFFLLAQVLKRGMAVAIAYAVWSAVGVTALAVLGALLYGETLGRLQILGIVLVLVGVVLLDLRSAH